VHQLTWRQLADTCPNEEREVVVRGVLLVAEQVLSEDGTRFRVEMGQCFRKGETHTLATGFGS
jgi:hypothetical protein